MKHSFRIKQTAAEVAWLSPRRHTSGTDSIAVGVHVGGDRQAIDHSIFVPEILCANRLRINSGVGGQTEDLDGYIDAADLLRSERLELYRDRARQSGRGND
jgi:hypothetical protein